MKMKTKAWLSEVHIPTYLLIAIFNIASGIDLVAVLVEFPLLVNRLPEGWTLPSRLTILTKATQVGMIIYAVMKYCMKDRLKEVPFVYFVIVANSGGLLALSFTWDKTMMINGTEYSVYMMAFVGLLSFADGLVAVVFLPYMKRYRPQYMSAFFLGGGMCAIIPVIIGMFQGIGERPVCGNETVILLNNSMGINYTDYKITLSYPSPKFSVGTFFLIVFGTIVLSGFAFTCLHFLPSLKKHQINYNVNMDSCSGKIYRPQNECYGDDVEMEPIKSKTVLEMVKDIERKHTFSNEQSLTTYNKIGHGEFAFCLFSLALSYGLMYGVFTSIQPFACLPYGNRAYVLAIRLCLAMNPFVSLLALFVFTTSKLRISLLNLTGLVFFAYILYLAVRSPVPPMKGTLVGEVLVIIASCAVKAIFNYTKSCVMYKIQSSSRRNAMMFAGIAMSIGHSVTGIVSFVLVNFTDSFKREPPCSGM